MAVVASCVCIAGVSAASAATMAAPKPPPISAVDRAACAHLSAARRGTVRLANFDVGAGVTSPTGRAAVPLLPHYPDKLFHDKITITPHRPITRPVKIDGFYCADGSRIGLWFDPKHPQPPIPYVTSAAVLKRAGKAWVTVSGRPQITDPAPEYFVEAFYYKPGIAMLRFIRDGHVIDRLVASVYVCRLGLPHC